MIRKSSKLWRTNYLEEKRYRFLWLDQYGKQSINIILIQISESLSLFPPKKSILDSFTTIFVLFYFGRSLTFHKSLLRHWFKCIFVSTCFHILTLTHTLHGFSFSAHVHHYCWYQNYWFKNRMLYSSQLKHCFLVLSLVSCDGYNILFVRM